MTNVYIADVGVLSNADVYEKLYSTVSPERKRKTDSLRFDKDKWLSLGAEALLKCALSFSGYDFDSLTLCENEFGKQYFKENGIHFNLSHSGTKVLCAVSDMPVGCDIEKISDADFRLAKRFFSPDEYDYLSSLPEDHKNAAFYRLWTLKESYMKALGLGFSLPMSDFSVFVGKEITVSGKYSENGFFFKEYTGTDGYSCAVCSQSREISDLNVHSFL